MLREMRATTTYLLAVYTYAQKNKTFAQIIIRNVKQKRSDDELVTGYFDFFAVSVPGDRVILGVFHLALHLGRLALDHSQVLQRLFDDDVSCSHKLDCQPCIL